ncbi:hypothetical protein ACFWM1_21930 [Nocardia sp. NPDC058379]|uniref:hypothetical protein n=1 Tax=unclassified Nocardia TaxID=2637762 RepID=UPI0036579CD1
MADGSGGVARTTRRIAVALLVCVTGLLTLTTVVAGFVRAELLDTDHYVETMVPLAEDPVVQDALAARLTEAVMTRVDVQGAATELVDSFAERRDRNPRVEAALRSVPALLTAQSEKLVRDAADALVRSDRFARLWETANRQAHRAMVAALTGREDGVLQVNTEGVVSISLEPMLRQLEAELEERGFALARLDLESRGEFVLVESEDLAKAQRAARLLDRGAIAFGIATLACAIGAVLVAGRGSRRRALLAVGLSVLVSMVVLAAALLIARAVYLDHLSARSISVEVARTVYDTLVHPLRVSTRVIALIGALTAVGAYLAGPSALATKSRDTLDGAIARMRRGEGGRVSGVVAANLGVLRTVVLIVAAAVFLLWDYPTVWVVVLIATFAVVALLALQILAHPRRAA